MKLPIGKRRSASMAKKASSGTRPGTETQRQPVIEPVEIGNAGPVEPKLRNAVQERGNNPRAKVRYLPREQRVPHAMLLGGEMRPVLRNEIGAPILPELARGGWHSSQFVNISKHSSVLCGNKKPRRSEAWRGGGPVAGRVKCLSRSPPHFDNNGPRPTAWSAKPGSRRKARSSRSSYAKTLLNGRWMPNVCFRQ